MKSLILLFALSLAGCHYTTEYLNIAGDVPDKRSVSEAHGVEARREVSTDTTEVGDVDSEGEVFSREEGEGRTGPTAIEPTTITPTTKLKLK